MIPMVVQEKIFLDVAVPNKEPSASFGQHSYQKTTNVHRQIV
jgi:hypothetical protein